ncbi:hypothetical protein CCB80_02640 [Armatimonadetes bacterium Uphvl-Ar1]|nr:hypothetical protein CCB80_02640 [Armatimonadetes bacterium Uphvl-Ar1]
MRTVTVASILVAGLGLVAAQGSEEVMTAAGLKSALESKGHVVTVLVADEGKELYQVKVEKSGFNIPVTASLSPSKSYMWFTVNLGPSGEKSKFADMLKKNATIMPSFFYVSGSANAVQMAYPIENRGVTADRVQKDLMRFTDDVVGSVDVWRQE